MNQLSVIVDVSHGQSNSELSQVNRLDSQIKKVNKSSSSSASLSAADVDEGEARSSIAVVSETKSLKQKDFKRESVKDLVE